MGADPTRDYAEQREQAARDDDGRERRNHAQPEGQLPPGRQAQLAFDDGQESHARDVADLRPLGKQTFVPENPDAQVESIRAK